MNTVDHETPWGASLACIHEIFEAHAERAADAVAAVFEGEELTYGDLNRRANRLAHRLVRAGVGPDMPVGVFVERSLDVLIALLGILKAGGAYLPLDPKYPRERLELMLAGSGAKVLVAEAAWAERLSFGGEVVSPAEGAVNADGARAAEGNPVNGARESSLAYVMFTSGSTGRPKGVAVTHKSVVRLVVNTNYVKLVPSDRVAHASNLSFDASTFEIWGALLNGARVVVVPQETLLSPEALSTGLRREGITVMFITTALLHQIASARAEAFRGLRCLVFGGEACNPEWVRRVLDQSAPDSLINGYGPTECTTFSTFYPVTHVPRDATNLPIGRPVSGTTVHVLGPDRKPVAMGKIGELYLGGDGLARGYLSRPELTSERFVPDPLAGDPAARLYRTGDLVKQLPDGDLIFLGRDDHQVKIRGFRIELGEIEAALGQHPSVRMAVVTAREEGPGDKRLVAYVVGLERHAASIPELHRFLGERLPFYMIPSSIVLLERLPMSPNGKVDRAALPAPSRDTAGVGDLVEPRSATEEWLTRAYAEILGLDKVGVLDDFFELGGSSLSAVRLLARLREQLGVGLQSRHLYESPRVMDLARLIEAAAPRPLAHIDLRAEAVLDPELRPSSKPARRTAQVASVFLTGATGFLGAFLLHDLLRKTEATVHCLVRAADSAEGMKRIQGALAKYGLWDERLIARIVPVPGDLTHPLLGLTPARFDGLAQQVGAIYHSAAEVNYIKPYAQHKAANVQGTQEIIRLAFRGPQKPLHYISTIAIFGQIGWFTGRKQVREEDDMDAGADYLHTDIGYSQSKWVAEKLVWKARERGLQATIFRPGFIMGHSQTGATNTSDFACRMIKGCVQLRAFPDLPDQSKEFLPVDFASSAIVHLSRAQSSLGKVFHLVPRPSHNIDLMSFFELIRAYGYSLKKLSYARWKNALIAGVGASGDDGLLPLVPMLTETIHLDSLTSWELYRNMPVFECRNTIEGLSGTSIACPAMNAELLGVYLSRLIRSGFLEEPPSPASCTGGASRPIDALASRNLHFTFNEGALDERVVRAKLPEPPARLWCAPDGSVTTGRGGEVENALLGGGRGRAQA